MKHEYVTNPVPGWKCPECGVIYYGNWCPICKKSEC